MPVAGVATPLGGNPTRSCWRRLSALWTSCTSAALVETGCRFAVGTDTRREDPCQNHSGRPIIPYERKRESRQKWNNYLDYFLSFLRLRSEFLNYSRSCRC